MNVEKVKIYLSKAVGAIPNQPLYIRSYSDIDKINFMVLYRITNISEDCVMLEYFTKSNDDEIYNILFMPAMEKDGSALKERCVRPLSSINLSGSVENKIMLLSNEIKVSTNTTGLRKNIYIGTCSYLKLNSIDITLNRKYKFDDEKLTITDMDGKTYLF
jgi:hypothetical protein